MTYDPDEPHHFQQINPIADSSALIDYLREAARAAKEAGDSVQAERFDLAAQSLKVNRPRSFYGKGGR